ncbi:MAG: hypothetical protein AAGA48_39290 [Myxococcota bacterium]
MIWWMFVIACKPAANQAQTELVDLQEGDEVQGFNVEYVYIDESDRPLGARLRHQHTGFELAFLRMRTVPQGYLWVNTVPDGDRGEPHTQEHLLLGKGNRGRSVATLEDMSLVSSSAFTSQFRTVYHFHTTAGSDVWFNVLNERLGALLFPDYSDEEIRREVHHYGVRDEPGGGLALEEKGTVYNEMDSSYQNPGARLWRQIGQDLYGVDHPTAYESGGLPSAIRTMTPKHIRDFHAATHQLANMGMIAVLPPEQSLGKALGRLDDILKGHQPKPTPAGTTFLTEDTLPPPEPVADRDVRNVGYPSGDPQAPGSVVMAWPSANRTLAPHEHTLISILLTSLAGNDSSNLYRAIVDSRLRERDTGARSVWGYVSSDLGFPVYFGVSGIPGAELDDETVGWLVERIRKELRDVAAMAPDDPALADLKQRLEDNTISFRRGVRRSISTPPGFGFRGTGTGWFDRLDEIDEATGFRRSLTLADHFDYVETKLSAPGNPFTEPLSQLGILEAEPLVYANRPDPAALESLSKAKQARLAAETEAIAKRLGVDDPQLALQQFRDLYDADTAALEAAEAVTEGQFVDNPPLVPDPSLDYTVGSIAGVPAVIGRFDAMTGADVRMYLSLAGLTEAEQRWLPVFTRLLTGVGVIQDGTPLSHVEVRSRLQREVLSASAWTSTNARTGRIELTLHASGTSTEEVDAALGWASTFLSSPDWRNENLPRIRDLVESSLSGLQQRMLGREESWVRNPKSAMMYGDRPEQLRSWSFLTQAHDVLRLYWRLTDPPQTKTQTAALALADLGERYDRDEMRNILRAVAGGEGEGPPRSASRLIRTATQVPKADREAMKTLAGHLERALADVPESSRAADHRYLVKRLVADWEESPTDALTELDGLRGRLGARDGARFVVTAGALRDGMEARVAPLLGLLKDGEPPPAPAPGAHVIRTRVADRGGEGNAAHFGLFDPNRRSGVHLHAGPGPVLTDVSEDNVLDYLVANTWGGGGAHGLFMATWGAGLAYSNGIRTNLDTGRLNYYAERCPSLGQTMDFVMGELAGAQVTPAIAEYAVAQGFYSRAASGYESRTVSMASDLIDARPPELTRAFREALLALRSRPDLAQALQARKDRVYGGVVPPGGEGLSLVIGDEAQLTGWATWLEAREAGTFQRIYPRDFWIVEPIE